ncbi:hypothetical protein [Planctomicrobium sp. SH664]|uniref:hypothetical protein n=1 Tax=Planctomicrobium sp. SH664 TaxID=3448125 RepID=UPI003F5B19E9
MPFNAIHSGIITLFAATYSMQILAQCNAEPPNLKACNNACEIWYECERSLAGMTQPELRQIMLSTDDESALIAASWGFSKYNSENIHPLSSSFPSSSWLLGYITGRLNVDPPEFWREGLLSLRLCDEGTSVRSLKEDVHYPFPLVKESVATIEIDSRTTSVPIGGDEKWPNGIAFANTHGELNYTYEIHGDNVIVAVFSCHPFEFALFMLDKEMLSVKWRAVVWPGCYGMITGPQHKRHEIKLVAHGEKVYVYGRLPGELYLNSFSVKDGTPLVRWSTSYW